MMHHDGIMRTTVSLDDDVLAAVELLRRDRGLGLSEALNEIARAGMVLGSPHPAPYVPRSAALGLKIDVANVAEVLELLEES